MTDKQAIWIFKAHKFCMKLQTKHPLIAAIGGTGLQFLMGYTYMTVLRQGARLTNDNEKVH